MNSDLPKVLHTIGGMPMIGHVLSAARKLRPDRLVIVIGHRRAEVQAQIDGADVEWAVQDPQMGTGHAVQQAGPILDGFRGEVIILSGDVPLLRAETLQRLLAEHSSKGSVATVLSTDAPEPGSYGRIVRDAHGNFVRIVEALDASGEEKRIREINSGVYCFEAVELFGALKEIRPNNSKGEYYLTDVIEVLTRKRPGSVQAVDMADFREIQGINTQAELAEADLALQRRIADVST
jgi:bifunctional UDP-N-acetylglucosamine pyrophosphorylase / glucosamine-1-phosphate N-acetyltransferase